MTHDNMRCIVTLSYINSTKSQKDDLLVAKTLSEGIKKTRHTFFPKDNDNHFSG